MPAGFLSVNDSNTVQIDENYFNLVLTRAGTTPRIGTGHSAYYRIPVTDNRTIIAFRPSADGNTGVRFIGTTVVSGTRYYNYRVWHVTNGYNLIANLQYYMFSPIDGPGANFGMQVFNEDEELVYDATRFPCKPIHFYGPGLLSSASTTGRINTSLGSGRTYAVVPADCAWTEDFDGTDWGYTAQSYSGVYASGYSRLVFVAEGITNGDPGFSGFPGGAYHIVVGYVMDLVIDVTNCPTTF